MLLSSQIRKEAQANKKLLVRRVVRRYIQRIGRSIDWQILHLLYNQSALEGSFYHANRCHPQWGVGDWEGVSGFAPGNVVGLEQDRSRS